MPAGGPRCRVPSAAGNDAGRQGPAAAKGPEPERPTQAAAAAGRAARQGRTAARREQARLARGRRRLREPLALVRVQGHSASLPAPAEAALLRRPARAAFRQPWRLCTSAIHRRAALGCDRKRMAADNPAAVGTRPPHRAAQREAAGLGYVRLRRLPAADRTRTARSRNSLPQTGRSEVGCLVHTPRRAGHQVLAN